MKKVLKLIVEEAKSVEQVLRTQAGLTKKEISRAKFRRGGIQKNGVQCRVTELAGVGDLIEICLEKEESASEHLVQVSSKLPPLEILYEDEDLLAVNKPAGVVTHPMGGHYSDTLSNQVMEYYRKKGEAGCVRSVGRLDKETSGVVIFAKNQVAAARLQRQREEGLFQKIYLAVAEGERKPEESWHRIRNFISRDPQNHLKMQVVCDGREGKEAITEYQVLYTAGKWSLVRLRLMTGRTHQIRVTMASLGFPLVGDHLYGGKMQESRVMLHAWKCRLYHPFSGEEVTLTASISEDLKPYIRPLPLTNSPINSKISNR